MHLLCVENHSVMKDQHTQGPLKGPILQVRKRPLEVVFFSFILFCFTPAVNAPFALVLGLLLAQLVGHPYPAAGGKAAHWLLQASVVGLGFGMNIHQATAPGVRYLPYPKDELVGLCGR